MQQPKQVYLELKWSAPWDPLMTTSNLLGTASDNSEDALSRKHSLKSDDKLLFSGTESVPSSNEGTTTSKKTAFRVDDDLNRDGAYVEQPDCHWQCPLAARHGTGRHSPPPPPPATAVPPRTFPKIGL